jgi:hypothetical protein
LPILVTLDYVLRFVVKYSLISFIDGNCKDNSSLSISFSTNFPVFSSFTISVFYPSVNILRFVKVGFPSTYSTIYILSSLEILVVVIPSDNLLGFISNYIDSFSFNFKVRNIPPDAFLKLFGDSFGIGFPSEYLDSSL